MRDVIDEVQDAEFHDVEPEAPKAEDFLDQQSPTVRQSRRREIEPRAQDSSGKGSRGPKCVSSWVECFSSL
jgi:hypothetical protein